MSQNPDQTTPQLGSTETVDSTWLAQLRREFVATGDELTSIRAERERLCTIVGLTHELEQDGETLISLVTQAKNAVTGATTAWEEQCDRADKLEAEAERLKTASIVPGTMQCAKCKFHRVSKVLSMSTGTVGMAENTPEPCPNGCGPLWPITWEQEAHELGTRLENFHDQIQQLKAELNRPDEIVAEPAADYDALRKQFNALRTAYNSKAKQCEHWRRQSDDAVRADMVKHRTEADAERDTNAQLTEALLAAEAERDALKEQVRLFECKCEPKLPDEIPDFSPGNGNKSRRRAAAAGINMDASMKAGTIVAAPTGIKYPDPVTDAERLCTEPTCWACSGSGRDQTDGSICKWNNGIPF